ncbi:MAG: ABC transporter permease subunit [Treponema sp.]|nr:ABC transporter permease subunit [Treponema sp.]
MALLPVDRHIPLNRTSRKETLKKYFPLYAMMLPGALYLIVNNYIPMAGIVIAFKQYNFARGFLGSPWVGLKNFEFLFASSDAWIITRNTLAYNAIFITLNTTLSVLFAIFICDIASKMLKKIFQSVILFPFLMSMVIVGYVVYAFFSMQSGIVNKTILPLLGKEPIMWYNIPGYWPAILITVNSWKGIGYGCLIYISSINGIDPTQFEAAELDGASKWQRIRHITLPAIIPPMITLMLLSVGKIFYSDFGLFYQIPRNSGPLFPTTNVIDTYVYRALMERGNISMSSAAGVYQSMVGFLLVLGSNWVVRKLSRENALF